jgi:hypothetical protein
LVTLRKNKFNFYIGGDLNNQEFIGESTSKKYTVKNDTISYLNSSVTLPEEDTPTELEVD